MVNNSKLTRIFNLLKKAEDKGVSEADIFNDFESTGNTRVIKHRLNKIIGSNAIVIVSGIWYLDEEYWNMTKSEFNKLLDRHSLEQISIRNNYTVFGIVAVFSILLVISSSVLYNLGRPQTIGQCLEIFNTDYVDEIYGE